MTARRIITAQDAVLAGRGMGRACTAKEIAEYIGGTDSRAVATALRTPTCDGRVTINYRRAVATFRFKRLSTTGAAR